MRPRSPTAEALASRLVAASAPQPGQPGHGPLVATQRALDTLADALARWFGPLGYHALLVRALAHARREHPALAGVRVDDPLSPALRGLDEAASLHGVESAADGAQAVLTAVIALLGRVVGDDMVLYLVEPRMDVPAPADPAVSERAALTASVVPPAQRRVAGDPRSP